MGGVFVVSLLRRIAFNILAVARKLTRHEHTREPPTWHEVVTDFLLAQCRHVLHTEAFDAVTC